MTRPGRPSSNQTSTQTQILERTQTKKPKLWRVLLLNDDYTPMDFVVNVLMGHFHKSEAEAHVIMLAVHHKGRGVAGVYTRDIAETKAAQVVDEARAAGFPLQVVAEPEEGSTGEGGAGNGSAGNGGAGA